MTISDVLREMQEADDYGGSRTRLSSLRKLLQAAPETVRKTFGENDTWLHVASERFLHGAVGVFLSQGTDPNARNSEGLVPLGAMFGEHDENAAAVRTAELLIEAGTDVNAATQDGRSLLYLAWLTVFPTIFDLLRSAGATWDLKTATLLGRDDVVAEILATNSDPVKLVKSTPGLGEDTIRSSQYRDPNIGRPAETLRLLLCRGLDPNSRCDNGWPLIIHGVTGAQNPEIIQALIDSGCDINVVHKASGVNQTPLDVARTYGHELSAAVLRAAGAKTYSQLRRKK